jgi:hypothetical protein
VASFERLFKLAGRTDAGYRLDFANRYEIIHAV